MLGPQTEGLKVHCLGFQFRGLGSKVLVSGCIVYAALEKQPRQVFMMDEILLALQMMRNLEYFSLTPKIPTALQDVSIASGKVSLSGEALM